jgi:hypothetical protein
MRTRLTRRTQHTEPSPYRPRGARFHDRRFHDNPVRPRLCDDAVDRQIALTRDLDVAEDVDDSGRTPGGGAAAPMAQAAP